MWGETQGRELSAESMIVKNEVPYGPTAIDVGTLAVFRK